MNEKNQYDNTNNEQMYSQQQYTYGNYFEIPKVQKKSPILGIISLILVFIAFLVSVFQPVFGIVLCIIIIILDITALVRKEKAIILPITGIVLGILVFMFSGLLAMIELSEFTDLVEQEEVLQSVEGQDVFSGRIFIMSDGSALYLKENGTYSWYQNNSVQDDNYYAGSYIVYNASIAEDYIVTDLKKYGINKQELDDYYGRNSDDEFYAKENLYCITMNCNYRLVAGEESENEDSLTPYYGFSDGTNYDLSNMNTGNYLTIKSVESIEEK